MRNFVFEESEAQLIKNKVEAAFNSWVIDDPYIEDPGISIHKAWMEGYTFAKNLALNALK